MLVGVLRAADSSERSPKAKNPKAKNPKQPLTFVVLYCNFRSLTFLGLLGFLRGQLKIKFIATLLSAAK